MARCTRTALLALLVSVVSGAHPVGAQNLIVSLFERYLDSLRQQSGIPGLSAALVQDGKIVWERGFGVSDVERSVAARPDTPYDISGLTAVLSVTVLLEQCIENGHATLDDRVQRWAPSFGNADDTLRDVLTHRSSNGGFKYDADRYAMLTGAIEACIQRPPMPLRFAIAQKIFDRLGMAESVPGQTVDGGSPEDRGFFGDSQLDRYGRVLQRLALPYRVTGGTPSLNTSPSKVMNAATGAISTVRDLARLDWALEEATLLHRDTMSDMWSSARSASGAAMPTGLGWFVQNYNGQPVYWQFGLSQGAYSSLILKVPGKHLTLILLANSDGLSAPFALQEGDVNASLFARAFLRLFVG